MAGPSAVTAKMVGDWSKQMAVPLGNALQATTELTGKDGRKAVEQAMVYMARSAKAATKQAKKNRKVLKGDRGVKYVEKIYKDGKIKRLYEAGFPDSRGRTWATAKEITSRGLAKRSWMWGVAGLRGGKVKGHAIAGVNTMAEFLSPTKVGLIMTNKLNYILKAAPAGVAEIAAQKASNQIMAQAAKKMERKFSVEIPRLAASRAKKAKKRLERAFKDGKNKR